MSGRLQWRHYAGAPQGLEATAGEIRAHIWFGTSRPKDSPPWGWTVTIARPHQRSFSRHDWAADRQSAADAANAACPSLLAEVAAADARSAELDRLIDEAAAGAIPRLPIEDRDEAFHRDLMRRTTLRWQAGRTQPQAAGLEALQAALSAYFYGLRTISSRAGLPRPPLTV